MLPSAEAMAGIVIRRTFTPVLAGVTALARLADRVAALSNAVQRETTAAEDCFLLQVEFHIISWTLFHWTRLLNCTRLLNFRNWTQ